MYDHVAIEVFGNKYLVPIPIEDVPGIVDSVICTTQAQARAIENAVNACVRGDL